jgi:hypothetical protein
MSQQRSKQIRSDAEAAAKERAKVIGAAAWYECLDKVLTPAELVQIRELWDTMPGSSCWTDAALKGLAQLAESEQQLLSPAK